MVSYQSGGGGANLNQVGRETNVVLLGWTQEYLRSLLIKASPDSVLCVAWDEFYRIYDDLLRRFAAARGLRGTDVDDCLQAVWLEIASSLTNFERPAGRPGLRSWLYTVVRSKSCNLLQLKARRTVDSLDVARLAGHEPAVDGPDFWNKMERQWKQALLESLLDEIRQEISDTNWQLLQMRFVQGCGVAQIGAKLGLAPERVRYRQRRLLKRLRMRAAALTGEPVVGLLAEAL